MSTALAELSPAHRDARSPALWKKVRVLVRKDLRIEARARETLPPMLAFAGTVTLLLAFALPPNTSFTRPTRPLIGALAGADVLAGFFWVTILFAALIGFSRTFEVERSDGALDPLLLAPIDRSGLYVAKALVNLLYLLAVQALLVPAFGLLFAANLTGNPIVLFSVIGLADIAIVAIGTLFAALAAQTRSRELMLPVLALPVLVPAFIAAVELSADAFAGASVSALAGRGWFGLLVAFDIIAVVIAALMFEFALEDA
ncbi:MAG TPA: heme exporter protein CcmB [Vicinamibacterales bacterium]|nr:heme exporter protein CcmB [Vicinamibacterales bacterium]